MCASPRTGVTTAGALLRLFRQQAVVGAALALLSVSFLPMPPIAPPIAPPEDAGAGAGTGAGPGMGAGAGAGTGAGPGMGAGAGAGTGAGPGMGAGAGAGAGALGLRAQLRHIARRRAPVQLATLGLLVGLSLVLQGMLPFVLAGVRSCSHTHTPLTLALEPRKSRRSPRRPGRPYSPGRPLTARTARTARAVAPL